MKLMRLVLLMCMLARAVSAVEPERIAAKDRISTVTKTPGLVAFWTLAKKRGSRGCLLGRRKSTR